MFNRISKNRALATSIAALFLGSMTFLYYGKEAISVNGQEKSAPAKDSVGALAKRKLELAWLMYKQLDRLTATGSIPRIEMVESSKRILESELEVAAASGSAPTEKLKFYEQHFTRMKHLEDEAKKASAPATTEVPPVFEYYRVEAELMLAKAKSKKN